MRESAALFLVALGVFAAFAGPRLKIHTKDNHFVYLADAFIDGRVEIIRKPHHSNDWASYEVLELKGESEKRHGPVAKGFFTQRRGKSNEFRLLDGSNITIPRRDRGASVKKTFVSFPPAPAVLMVPFVLLAGYGANDVIFTILFAALNAVLALLVLQKLTQSGHSERSTRENIWLAVLLIFGTAHLWCGVLGQVWFTALIVGVTFNLLYIYFGIDTRRPFLAGLSLAGAFSTRTALLFAAVFFYHQLFWGRGRDLSRGERWRRFAWFSTPCVIVGLSLLYYNYVRFESPWEFGHTYLASGTIARIRDFGLFHINFLGRNLTAAFTLLPRVTDTFPYIQLSNHGLSILLTTPAVVLVLWPKRSVPIVRSIGLAAACVAVPILLYQNTGWIQFSYRFALDVLPYIVAALAIGARPLDRWFKALIIAGILVNAAGAATFHRVGKLYADFTSEEPTR